MLADAELAKDYGQLVSIDGLDGRGRIGEPENVVAIMLFAHHYHFPPKAIHVVIVFIALGDHENMITFKSDF